MSRLHPAGVFVVLLALALCAGPTPAAHAQATADEPPRHPMDPLTAQEYAAVLTALKAANHVGEAGLYPLITLEEPPKAEVRAWRPGDPVPRRALAVVKQGPQTFEAVVDLTRDTVASWEEIEGVEPGILLSEEWSIAQRVVWADRAWRDTLRARGVSSLQNVVCVPNTVGYFGAEEEADRRLVRVVCYDSGGTRTYWGRPIEGLIADVDLNAREVVRITDYGAAPIPAPPPALSADSMDALRAPLHPIAYTQAEGPTFSVDGRSVAWDNWAFHFRIDPRPGLVVSLVRYRDDGRERSVLYQGSLSELFVPYMSPDAGWYFKTYLDAGEYGLGKLTSSLTPGIDCPPNAHYVDAVFADDWGDPYPVERAACLFERYAGGVAWRHDESVNDLREARRQTDLVLRSAAAVGNYDYLFDWVFRQDGSIAVNVGASGIDQVRAVAARTAADDPDGRDTAYGRMVAEHTLAVNHDHFFSFRLDLDVDGPQNSLVVDRLVTRRLDEAGPRRSVWVLDPRTPATEQEARLRINFERPALWRVVNPNETGPMGYPVSYQLKPHANAVSLMTPDDFPRRRAGFTDFHLWVTPHHPRERYAAGRYPNQSRGGDGLPRWTGADRIIEDTDIVLWYTLGFHHVVRAEDWPVLPTAWHGFELRPFDFFVQNPALDLPR